LVHTNQKKYVKIIEKQNKFAGNSKKWVYGKCAEFRFDRTLKGVIIDVDNGF
jgi:hypothetical protein